MGKVDEGEGGKEKKEGCGEEGNVRKQEGQGKKGANEDDVEGKPRDGKADDGWAVDLIASNLT
eukprot:5246571-Prorocentrum_lima.AAC.1